jgi:Domain of unknown function (DU1801)
MKYPFASPQVETAFHVPDPIAREGLLALRNLILDTAHTIPKVGRIEESLRWGQPAYLTSQSGSGTTLRVGLSKKARFALFVHCQTSVISRFAQAFPGWDRIDGNRAVLFDTASEIDSFRHGWLIKHALTYHRSLEQV